MTGKRPERRATGRDVLESLRIVHDELAATLKHIEDVHLTRRQLEVARHLAAGIDGRLDGVLHALRESGNAKAAEEV